MTTSVYYWNRNLELIQKTLFIDVQKNNKLCWQKKTFSVSDGALLNKLKLLSANVLIIFLKISMKNLFSINSRFKPKNALMLSQKGIFYCRALKNPHAFFILQGKSFCVFNRVPSDTLKNFFLQNILLFFQCPTCKYFSSSMSLLQVRVYKKFAVQWSLVAIYWNNEARGTCKITI